MRLLHPAHIEIVEALQWIDEPLSASELRQVLDAAHAASRLERRLRQLAKLNAVHLADNARVAQRPTGVRQYRLLKQPGDESRPPQYDLSKVKQVILEEVVEAHPRHLTIRALRQRIVGDPSDEREVETANQAIRELRQVGLFNYKDRDQVVEPTPAARHAFDLLA